MLSVSSVPPVQAVIDRGGCPLLVACLDEDSSAVQFEAAWAITNIAAGTTAQTLALLDAGASESLLRVCASSQICDRAELCCQCLDALGNIAGDSDVRPRDQLLQDGVIGHLGSLFERIPGFTWDLHGRIQVLQSLTRLMSNLCSGQPAPPLEAVDCAFDYFVQVLLGTDDPRMLQDALLGLDSLLGGAADGGGAEVRAARMLAAGLAPGAAPPSPHPLLVQAVKCFGRGAGGTRGPALRLLGKLVSLPSEQFTDAVISAGALPAFHRALLEDRASHDTRLHVAWALSNIATGSDAQAQHLLDTKGLLGALCRAIEEGPGPELRRECAWAVASLARRCSGLFATQDARRALSALACALKSEADDAPPLSALLEACEALLRLEEELAAHAEELGLPREAERLERAREEAVRLRAARLLGALSRAGADRENKPPEERTPRKGKAVPSAICGGSPIRPAAYKFGA